MHGNASGRNEEGERVRVGEGVNAGASNHPRERSPTLPLVPLLRVPVVPLPPVVQHSPTQPASQPPTFTGSLLSHFNSCSTMLRARSFCSSLRRQ